MFEQIQAEQQNEHQKIGGEPIRLVKTLKKSKCFNTIEKTKAN